MLNAVPPNTRAVAISQRGLGGSTPLSPEQESGSVPPRELYDILVNDLHGVLRFMRDNLAVPVKGGVTILAWSMSSSIVLGLFTPEHISTTKQFLPFLKRVIFWDPPLMGVHGLPPTATGIKFFRIETFIQYVAAFFDYPAEYLSSQTPGKFTEIFTPTGSTLDSPGYLAWMKKAVDLRSSMANRHPCIANDRAHLEEKSREAHRILGKTDLTKEVLYGTKATPENLEGCWVSRDWIKEGGGSCKVYQIALTC
jgi:pimeloyl-ACP methyl ester carboxylesterase